MKGNALYPFHFVEDMVRNIRRDHVSVCNNITKLQWLYNTKNCVNAQWGLSVGRGIVETPVTLKLEDPFQTSYTVGSFCGRR